MLAPRDSFDDAVLAAMPILLRRAVSLTRNVPDAEDLVQTTVMRALRYRSHFTPGTVLHAWLFTIMRNHFLQDRRTAARMVEDPDGGFALALAVDASQEDHIYAQEVVESIDWIPEHMRETVKLAALGLDPTEIAAELHIPIGTAKSRLNRGREKLVVLL